MATGDSGRALNPRGLLTSFNVTDVRIHSRSFRTLEQPVRVAGVDVQ